MTILSGCGDGGKAPTITAQPANQTIPAGQTATFSVTVLGTAPFRYEWRKSGTAIAGATLASYTTPPASTFDNASTYSVIVSNGGGTATSSEATLTVKKVTTTDVLNSHNDLAGSGQNLTETTLTLSNVTLAKFGKVGFYPVDGLVDAQPLYASNVVVPNNGKHNLLIAATENGSVYAFDADSGATIWQVSTLKTGETPSPDPGWGNGPRIGINATPVIDRTLTPKGVIYVVAMSIDGSSNHFQRLHALDLARGTELFGGPVDIQATYPGTGANSDGVNVIFDPMRYRERCALLLLNGVIYTTWASHYDKPPYTGWIIGYSATTLKQASVLNVTPNGSDGAIWMSGAGPVADSSGNIYFLDANGDFDENLDSNGFPSNGNYGNSFMKLSTSSGLAVADYFAVDNEATENAADTDLGSGGALVLPDLSDGSGNILHLAVGAGKNGNLYVVNRDSMGKFSANDSGIYQELAGALPGGVFSAPAYFNNTLYYGPVGSAIRAFTIANAKVSSAPAAQTANTFAYPGATPSISANGTVDGILWAVENTTPAVLHAYSAASLNELYNSNQASAGRDQFGAGNKFMTPTVVNGKVFVGTPNGVAVFGLLP